MSSSPPPPSFRPSRNPIVRMILWITEPSMIKGVAVGLVLAMLGGVALKLNAAWYIASGLLLVICALVFGAVVGHYLFEAKRKRAMRHGAELLRQASAEVPGIGDQLAVVVFNRDTSALPGVWERLRRMQPAVEEIVGLGVAAFFRTAALSALFAVLGSAISFAVFLTSYMQVERMTEQNELVKAQTALTQKQLEFEERRQQIEVSLSIADRRQTTAREVFAAIASDPGRRGEGDDRKQLSRSNELLIGAAIAQLQPYHSVDPTQNAVARELKSPEQEQILRYLAAVKIDVAEIDFSRAFLDYADLHALELPAINLEGVKLRFSALYDAKFVGARFALADLSQAQLSRVDLTSATLTDASLRGTILVDAILTEANLVRTDLTGANLKKAVLSQVQLGSAKLIGADLTQCNLTSADIADADVTLADLSTLEKAPIVPKTRSAAFWWLAVYSDDYAGKLGVPPAQLAASREALARFRAAPTPEAAAAIVDEHKRSAPKPPA